MCVCVCVCVWCACVRTELLLLLCVCVCVVCVCVLCVHAHRNVTDVRCQHSRLNWFHSSVCCCHVWANGDIHADHHHRDQQVCILDSSSSHHHHHHDIIASSYKPAQAPKSKSRRFNVQQLTLTVYIYRTKRAACKCHRKVNKKSDFHNFRAKKKYF